MNISDFANDYKNRLAKMIQDIDNAVIEEIISTFESASAKKSRIYVIGNGGSAATASHWQNDFAIGLKRRGIITFDMCSLVDNTSVLTATANDIGYENVFHEQLRDILKPEDVVLAISCSGNSPNVVKAVEYAKEVGSVVIGCSGFDGGKLRELADVKFHVDAPKGDFGIVEDVHMVLDHLIYSYYIQKDA